MFGMALTRPSLTMQLTREVDVFVNVYEQKADTSSNYCDTVQPYNKKVSTKKFQFLSNVTPCLDFFGNDHIFELLNFAR